MKLFSRSSAHFSFVFLFFATGVHGVSQRRPGTKSIGLFFFLMCPVLKQNGFWLKKKPVACTDATPRALITIPYSLARHYSCFCASPAQLYGALPPPYVVCCSHAPTELHELLGAGII